MMLNCLIIDDEPLARQQIEGYVSRVPFLKLIGSARNPVVAKTMLDSEAVDLIFLDVKMPHMSGIEFIRQQHSCQQVILITAFPEYAVDGFELEVTDYLMKPLTYERFLKATEKALAKVNGSQSIKAISDQPNFLYVRCNQRYEKILIDHILFIESMLNYINIITINKRYITYSSLKNMQTNLPQDKFLRIHKSYLIAINHIEVIENHQVQIKEYILPISRSNKQAALQVAINRGLFIS